VFFYLGDLMLKDEIKYCPNCGHKIESDKSFCIKCGKKLIDNDFNKMQHAQVNEIPSTQKNNIKTTDLNPNKKFKNYKNINKNRKNNKKIIGSIVIILLLLFISYQFVFVPYNNNQNNIKYNEGLKLASDYEKNASIPIEKADEKYLGVITNTSSKMEYANALLEHKTFMLNQYLPDLKKEMEILNDTLTYANGNQTKIDFINLQIERLKEEYQWGQNEVEIVTDIHYDFMSENRADLEKDFNNQDTNNNNNNKVLDEYSLKVKTLLNNNPDFHQTVKELDLFNEFYGDFKK